MIEEALSVKFLILYLYVFCTLYVHYRGNVRHTLVRQVFDHSTFMAPINAFMYFFSSIPNQVYIDSSQFPQLAKLRENWREIQEEAKDLFDQGYIRAAEKYNDIGFNSFFRTGWKRFYLKWYDTPLPSAKALCPKTVALLESIPGINAAMFALLPKGSRLVKHRDPYAGSLRYHLGLITPNSEKCYINVDGINYFWKDGEEVIFDETYIHYAENVSDQDRIILFCDIARPMRNRIATKINVWFSRYIMSAAATQNLETDRVGFINKLFKYLYSIRLVGKRIKSFNKTLYYFIKYALFIGIAYLIFFLK